MSDETAAEDLYKPIQTIGVQDTLITIGGRAVGMITGLRITADPKDPKLTRIKLWRPLSPDLPRLITFVLGREDPHDPLRVTLRSHTHVDLVIEAVMSYEVHGVETDVTGDAETRRRAGHALSHSNYYLDTLTLTTYWPLDVTYATKEIPAP